MIRGLLAFALATLVACFGSFGLLSAAEQQPAPRRIGVLLVDLSPESKEAQAFRQTLRDAGYAEAHDLVIEWRFANGDYGQIPQLATALVEDKVDVIVVDGMPAAQAVKRATSTIPIVMATVADPAGSGLVAGRPLPGGNITGLSATSAELAVKRLQLLKETIPRLTRVAVLWLPAQPWSPKVIEDLKAVALSLSIELNFVSAREPEEIGPAFLAVNRGHAQALYVLGDYFLFTHRRSLLDLASKARLPVMYGARHFVEEGGLMSYGSNYSDLYRRSAGYVVKILKGAKPGDLPIEQPIQFELVVNLKTAGALGITIPESVLQRADEVIR